MRVVWAMVWAQLLDLLRDRKALLLILAMPLVLTAILGFALNGLFAGKPLPVVRVVVHDADGGAYAQQLTAFLKGQSLFRVSEAASAESARQALASGQADVALEIPHGASGVIDHGGSAQVNVEAPVQQAFRQGLVQQYVDGFGSRWSAVSTAIRDGLPPASAAAGEPLQIREAASGTRPLNAKTYYAYAMMAMFLLLHAVQRAGVLVRIRQSDQFKRIAAGPVSTSAVAVGDLISTLFVLAAQCLVLFAAYRWILGADTGPPLQMGVLTGSYLFALAGLSLVIGRWVRSEAVVDGLAGIGVNVMAVLGGSMYPVYGFPDWVQRLAQFLPNGRILKAWLDSAMGVSWHEVWVAAVYLLAVALVCLLAAAVRRPAVA
ncbi:ABC transporter permease [Alicyclobacillus macrosporangiidus]|uniref:ABC-2 family transporter protein n=1 Tax=Alicyclobacillus macrosporangiidus TaxID=392015 RepID=A0A1I7FBN5_9BACL|nr:ABC transporter permease [Alicyclobacillus macrosporangiidus]SFU33608.1 ABC-2 family transporter protein [Alicyclobacillus macrosporangiidus]